MMRPSFGDTAQKRIYLTSDAGYENGCTAQILDALQKHHAPAAFFLVGNYIERNPDSSGAWRRRGIRFGNHTYHHWDMSEDRGRWSSSGRSSSPSRRSTVTRPGRSLQNSTARRRASIPRKISRMAQQLGYHTVFWSLAYVDWLQDDQPTSEQAMPSSSRASINGAVVLLHSTSQTNAAILDSLLTRWEEMGLFVR